MKGYIVADMTEICATCGFSYGSHRSDNNQCPKSETAIVMNWSKESKGEKVTRFKFKRGRK